MVNYSLDDLIKARKQLESLLSKLEKVEPKLKPGSSQHSLLKNRVNALNVALALIERELEVDDDTPD